MANFIRKIVDRQKSRSKSPQKAMRHNSEFNRLYLGLPAPPPPPRNPYLDSENEYLRSMPHSAKSTPSSPRKGRAERRHHGHGEDLPPVCHLPLPPSPATSPLSSPRVSRSRMSGPTIGMVASNNSNEGSVGVHTWNTEKEDDSGENDHLAHEVTSFFLNSRQDINHFNEPKLFDGELLGSPLFHRALASSSSTMHMNGHPRARSVSPQKKRNGRETVGLEEKVVSRSKSPQKRRTITQTLDFLNSQCHLEGCSVGIVVESTRFLICRHQLAHASDYFRQMFMSEGPPTTDLHVSVSGMTAPTPVTQFRWFVESAIPCPALKDIGDDTLETCMRLSRRFESRGLEMRCAKYIIENRPAMVALCWLNWSLKHKLDGSVKAACVPSVARLALSSLEEHRHMMSEATYADILAAKLRGTYNKAVSVFETIHRMDHFTLEMDRCPRCGRTKDRIKVRVHVLPCRKLIGCEKCVPDWGCELERKAQGELQAYFQCAHALLPLNDTTDECHCQTSMLSAQFSLARPPIKAPLDSRGRRKKHTPIAEDYTLRRN